MEMPNASRRRFLTLSFYMGEAVLLSAPIMVRAMNATRATAKPVTSVDISTYADGRKDATDAIQALIDLNAKSGEVVNIPKGVYLIDAEKGLRLHNGTKLKMDPDAKLVALPEKNANYSMIKIYGVHDVEIIGGSVIGERNHHLGNGGEWGFGIDIKGSTAVHISNIAVSDCWGDGFYVGSKSSGVTLDNVTSFNNRRQGLSITSGDGISITNSKFLSTSGTAPSAGIDLEPNKGESVSNVTIQNCEIRDNAGYGVLALIAVSGLKIIDCSIVDNGLYGVNLKSGVSGAEVVKNNIVGNKKRDIFIEAHASAIRVEGNIHSQP